MGYGHQQVYRGTMKHVMIKIYAAFHPADEALFSKLAGQGDAAIPIGEEWLFLEKDLIRVCFEGLYFPLEETLDILGEWLPKNAQGKLDYLDLEEWKLTRYTLEYSEELHKNIFKVQQKGLNSVLDYSGH